MDERRIVVTGRGILSCVGNTPGDVWNAVTNGKCGIGPVTRFDASDLRTRIAGEIKDFDPTRFLDPKEARHMDLFSQYAVCAAKTAIADAGLPDNFSEGGFNSFRAGIAVSSGIGGLGTMVEQDRKLFSQGARRVSPFAIPMMLGDSAAGNISIACGARGPNLGVVSACATGTNSIGEAMWMIKRGDADIMLAGGVEASVLDLSMAGFCALKAMSQRNDDPLHASRPFDADRDGFVLSEGAGVLVLEELEHARKRGAPILAEVAGYGASGDAYHITCPHPEGLGAANAILMALQHAHLNPEDVDYINAHGTSTQLNDKYETLAIKRAFGDSAGKVSVSSTKGSMGHALGAAGGLESILCVEAILHGVVPPTINYETPDPECDLDITPNTAKERSIRVAMNINLGFGGHNGVLIFKRYE